MIHVSRSGNSERRAEDVIDRVQRAGLASRCPSSRNGEDMCRAIHSSGSAAFWPRSGVRWRH